MSWAHENDTSSCRGQTIDPYPYRTRSWSKLICNSRYTLVEKKYRINGRVFVLKSWKQRAELELHISIHDSPDTVLRQKLSSSFFWAIAFDMMKNALMESSPDKCHCTFYNHNHHKAFAAKTLFRLRSVLQSQLDWGAPAPGRIIEDRLSYHTWSAFDAVRLSHSLNTIFEGYNYCGKGLVALYKLGYVAQGISIGHMTAQDACFRLSTERGRKSYFVDTCLKRLTLMDILRVLVSYGEFVPYSKQQMPS